MRIISDLTRKEYATVEECLAAEKEYNDALARKEEEKKQLSAERADRAKEIENARDEMFKAQKHYGELVNKFVNDYGYYHSSIDKVDSLPIALSLFDKLF